MQRYRKQREHGWSSPDPGLLVREWTMTRKQVGADNAEHCGKKETLMGILDWRAGREASHSPSELQ